jgi:hypothetical protein
MKSPSPCDLCAALAGLPAYSEPHPKLVLTESLPVGTESANPARRDRYRCTACGNFWVREITRFQSGQTWVRKTASDE